MCMFVYVHERPRVYMCMCVQMREVHVYERLCTWLLEMLIVCDREITR